MKPATNERLKLQDHPQKSRWQIHVVVEACTGVAGLVWVCIVQVGASLTLTFPVLWGGIRRKLWPFFLALTLKD